jgi:hypothetical protein
LHIDAIRRRVIPDIVTEGVPFASAKAIYGLSQLSVWWLRLEIQIERITPGHPNKTADTSGCI